MRTIESLIIAVIFIVYNILLIGHLDSLGFGLIPQLWVAWAMSSILLFCGYVWNEERKKRKVY